MKKIKMYAAVFAMLLIIVSCINACRPIRNFTTKPKPWSGQSRATSKLPVYDPAKRTIFIIADDKLTELFDMLAPFYLFNATEKANVYIVAKEKTPILIKKDLFVCPQLTFGEADSMHLRADLIVIPALSIRDEHQDTVVISWIKNHFSPTTRMLAICDGASTAAATGLYDGKPITCHASDIEAIQPHFNKPVWVQQVTVAKSGNVFSTAGVSNAVEGSLAVINELFGTETTQKVAASIHYPHEGIRLSHKSIALSGGNKFEVIKKVFFKRNRDIGVLLQNGMNEFAMASMIDTYNRTFPASFKTYILKDTTISTRYGLSLIHTGNNSMKGLDELHVMMPGTWSETAESTLEKINIVRYDNLQHQYLFDAYFKRIREQYGDQFEKFVKISLDYN
ncbi:DJ-1/PfpI family protein [Flavihumibacter fluvii]|uniref:DJ-1/PfpI family protein n=1 Tax=Flavihumibacter fluvii TaxID=2838157 RepID=UPI001BDF5B62|nr:DJ-1/PfpI family protein [Flavihumibacter fluvii]ULQ50757.1 DJ-1/PfpI family protein [Flavihumibacter fluvii]